MASCNSVVYPSPHPTHSRKNTPLRNIKIRFFKTKPTKFANSMSSFSELPGSASTHTSAGAEDGPGDEAASPPALPAGLEGRQQPQEPTRRPDQHGPLETRRQLRLRGRPRQTRVLRTAGRFGTRYVTSDGRYSVAKTEYVINMHMMMSGFIKLYKLAFRCD